MAFIPNNVYILYCSAAPGIVLDLVDGSTDKGTPCHGWSDQLANIKTFNQQWLISEVEGQGDVFTLRNLRSGTYLDLSDGEKKNGTKVQGWAKSQPANEKNQQWKIIPAGSNYRLQNVAGGTYIDIKNGQLTPGGIIQSWEYKETPTQEWTLHRVSRTGDEIKAIVQSNAHIGQTFESYLADGLYITLRESVRNDVYKDTGINHIQWRQQIFDCDDFAFAAKAEVAKWGNKFLRVDGFAILFGIMFGTDTGGGRHAYNWYLNDDFNGVMFFEPRDGTELADIGYKAFFGVF